MFLKATIWFSMDETTNQHSSLAASKILNPDQGYYVGVVKK
jgi:hypothetical protein